MPGVPPGGHDPPAHRSSGGWPLVPEPGPSLERQVSEPPPTWGAQTALESSVRKTRTLSPPCISVTTSVSHHSVRPSLPCVTAICVISHRRVCPSAAAVCRQSPPSVSSATAVSVTTVCHQSLPCVSATAVCVISHHVCQPPPCVSVTAADHCGLRQSGPALGLSGGVITGSLLKPPPLRTGVLSVARRPWGSRPSDRFC